MTLLVDRVQAQEGARVLAESYPDAHCELDFENAFELLVATVLSAQTTDARVNQVTPSLFALGRTPQEMAQLSIGTLEEVLRPLGMFRRRAAAVRGLSVALCAEFGGEVPGDRHKLESLPGVGRKTANVVLGNWFGEQEITVDTHVGRVTRRLGWQDAKTPLKAEEELWKLLPEAPWTDLCHQLIFHGRRVCHSRRPQCDLCPLADLCPSFEAG